MPSAATVSARVAAKITDCVRKRPLASIELRGDRATMARLLITFGGSHRKYDRQRRAFEDAGIELDECGAASLGSKLRHGIVPDTAEARALVKEVGASVARKQWAHLKDEE